jgi:hypothetical protein
MKLSLAVLAIQTVILHFVFKAVTRRIPPSPQVDVSHLPAAERQARGKRMDRLTVVPMFLLWPFFAAVWVLAFQGLAWWAPNNRPGVEYVVYSNFVYRLFSGLFAGFFLAGIVGIVVLRQWLGRNYAEWMACRDAHFKHDLRRWLYVLVVWWIPLFAQWDFHWATTYTVFTDDAIVIKEVWSLFEERYGYDRVRAITMRANWVPNPNNEFLPTAGVYIDFADGRPWSNAQAGLWFDKQDLGAIELTSVKSGKPINIVP